MNYPAPSPSVRASHSPDGSVLIDVEQGLIFSLNSSGSIVWSQLEQGRTTDQIAEALASHFDIPHDQALRDILALLRALEDRHLVRAAS